jgi:hypothetical protein
MQFAEPLGHTRLQHWPWVQGCCPKQTIPQDPQFCGSLCTLASHPSLALALQSIQPGSHVPMAHTPPAQLAVAWGTTQTPPHPPQLAGSLSMSTSQPFASMPSQFLNAGSHIPSAHAPFWQVEEPFGYGAHGVQDVTVHP